MANDSVLEIVAYGAWNGGTVVDNSIYEPMQLQFKGGIPVNTKTIEERIGVRARKVAGRDERIGVTALQDLLEKNDIDLARVKLVIEHQANFALIPLTLAQVLDEDPQDMKAAVANVLANKMVTNVQERGNCSVVCMQRLPYDLKRGALQPDEIQGFKINQNLEQLKQAKLILNDSVGAGMTRSSFIQNLS